MADSLLEQTRGLHEDMERMERVIVKDLRRDMKSHKEKLMQSHRVKRRLDTIQEAARKLLKIYEDEDGARKEDIAALASKDNAFAVFYERFKDIKDYHTRFAVTDVTEAETDEPLLKEEPAVAFTGEEVLGRYLDLHNNYSVFQNSKFGTKQEYYEYVAGLAGHLANVTKQHKTTSAYKRYVQGLLDYLFSFYTRTQPLAQLGKQLDKVAEATREAFEQGTLPGGEVQGDGKAGEGEEEAEPSTTGGPGTSSTPGALDLHAFSAVEELEALDPDRLKEALSALGLKCGGTPKERAARLWLTRSTPLHLLNKKHFAKGVARPPEAAQGDGATAGGQLAAAAAAQQQQTALEVATLEAKFGRLCELLANVISDTKGRLEKRQAQTYEELLAEQEEAAEEAAGGEVAGGEGSDGEDDFVYNPLKLPLGWDGKPIPYWLYKLHGLNQEFTCEICGNYSYWGRRAFERHFKEWRHQNGMRALGIPNNKNFFEVTRIEDAQALWKNIQEKQKGGFKAEVEEEFEDDSGNVYNKRTYLDLKKQGLL